MSPRVPTALAAVCCLASLTSSARGLNGIVASEHRLASRAGVEILRHGGNAVDAAVATALAVGVLSPSSCGLGGGGFMLIFDHATGRTTALDYRERAPATATRVMFVRGGKPVAGLSRYGGLAVGVPGEVAGAVAALERAGTLPLAAVAAPAIRHAREGFPVEEHLARMIEATAKRIAAEPVLAATFLHEDGTPLHTGETLKQPAVAETLERIAGGGKDAFYSGPIAQAIAARVAESGGVLTTTDLADYSAVWRAPVRRHFHGYDILSMPPPSSGGGVLIEILGILERDDLTTLGHNSPTYLHLLAESMQFAFADRAEYYGDPDFVAVPLKRLLSPQRARRLRKRITAAKTFGPNHYGHRITAVDGGTSHISVIDGRGNAVALTTSINTAFGSMLVAGHTGVILNNTMDDFSAQPGVPNVYGLIGSEANAVAPRKRPLSSMSPTIVLRDGEAVAVAGGSGGPRIISSTAQVLLNVLAFGMGATAAVSAPRIHHQWVPPVLRTEASLPIATRRSLARRGHQVRQAGGLGAVQLIVRNRDGSLAGAADPRKGGQALSQ